MTSMFGPAFFTLVIVVLTKIASVQLSNDPLSSRDDVVAKMMKFEAQRHSGTHTKREMRIFGSSEPTIENSGNALYRPIDQATAQGSQEGFIR